MGWIGVLIYVYVSYETQGIGEFVKHFLSTENTGIRFRALILFAPLITMAIAYLVNEREKYLQRIMVSEAELKMKNERLSALRSIELAISKSIDLQATLNILVEKIIMQLNIDATDVLLLASDTSTLVCSAGKGFHTEDALGIEISTGCGFAGRIAASHEKICIPDFNKYLTASGDAEFSDARDSYLYETEKMKTYFGIPLISHDRFLGVLEIFHRSAYNPTDDWYSFLETFAAQAAIAINKASLFSDLQDSNIELVRAYDTTIEGWARALDYRDKETEGHSRRVTDMTEDVARTMGIDGDELLHIRRGALLHDIGKLGVPDRILLKKGKHDPDERAIMERHPDMAFKLLSPIPFLKPAIDIPYFHHEKWDGTGYPQGLIGKDIPLAARIFSVVDVWDALRSDRPYRKAWSKEKTLDHIKSLSGKDFDPTVVDVFVKHIAS
jgi:HD-GYP domain-containing protein (c-di-GMP phosphodiesterase class II)